MLIFVVSIMLLVIFFLRTRCQHKEPKGTGVARKGSAAYARFRLGSPRFHEPEDHADVSDSLVGQRYG